MTDKPELNLDWARVQLKPKPKTNQNKKMSKFTALEIDRNYDIINGETGHWRTQGIQGSDAMSQSWDEGDEAWPAGETEFSGEPVEVAE